MKTLKLSAALLLAIGLATVGGWFWGSRGAESARRGLAEAGLRHHLVQARASLLQARVDLFEVNFGNASRSLDAARADLVTLEGAFTRAGNTDAVNAVHIAMAGVAEAQQSAARLDRSAQALVARALDAVGRVLADVQ